MRDRDRDNDDTHDPDRWRRLRPFRPKFQPITFIAAGSLPSTFAKAPTRTSDGAAVAAAYLRIVGAAGPPPSTTTSTPTTSTTTPTSTSSSTPSTTTPTDTDIGTTATTGATPPSEVCSVCETCGLPVGADPAAHLRTTAHQSAEPHSHPPHPLARSSVGLRILEGQGWDPDARVGLGADGRGVRYPVKAVKREGRGGVGDDGKEVGKGKEVKGKVRVEKLGAKEARKGDIERRKVRERVAREMRGGMDVEAFLRGDKVEGLR
ncbi:hypothetical protein EDC01DRAFT_784269 [Geopyxis carbonaria]|nr:hypothetical protein EDC01DRAFT_784269 [Geopyxis carbonaria]